MRLQRQSNRQLITLDSQGELGAGGEAQVFALIQNAEWVAKIYRKPKPQYIRKLAAMLTNPPDELKVSKTHLSFAWPLDLLLTTEVKPQLAGFLMPRVSGMRPIIDFYNPKTRRAQCPLFDYFYLHRAARNLAGAVSGLHTRGYVIGDVNESNILLTDTALVTLVDLDSIQVRDPETGVMYRCPVGKPEFTPPELQGQPFADIDRTPEHDVFGLAVLIFQLLMEGTHPFAGVYQLPGDPPAIADRIASGHFPYSGRKVPYSPMKVAPAFEILHPNLQKLFIRCFEDGHSNPKARPDAQTWKQALMEAEAALVTCSLNEQHRYGNHLTQCPWCLRTQALGGRDPFPSKTAVQQGHHLKPIPVKKIPILPAPLAPLAPKSPSQTALATIPKITLPPTYRPKKPILELNVPLLNPLIAGLIILTAAVGAVWYGNLPSRNFDGLISNPSSTPSLPTVRAQIINPNPISQLFVNPREAIAALSITPGNLWISNTGTVRIGEFPSLKQPRKLQEDSVSAIVLSQDGQWLASASRNDDRVTLWQLPNRTPHKTLTTHKVVVSLGLSPQRQLLATGSRDNTLKLWNSSTEKPIKSFDEWNAGWINAIAISPNEQILIAGTESGRLFKIDLNSLQDEPIGNPASVAPIKTLMITPNHQTLIASSSSQIYLWDLATKKLKATLQGHNSVIHAIAISPDGKSLVSSSRDRTLIWDLTTLKPVDRLETSEEIVSLAFSPDGKYLMTGNSEGLMAVRAVNVTPSQPQPQKRPQNN